MTTLTEALRRRFRSPAEAMAALGLDISILEDGSMTYHHHYDRRGRDEELDDHEREREARDAVRRALDAADFDPQDVIEALAEYYPGEVGSAAREIGEDRGGPHRWARDRRERRALDAHLRRAGRTRRLGARDEPEEFPGMPRPGGSMVPLHRGEDYRHRGADHSRGRLGAFDMALGAGSTDLDTFARFFGAQAAAIERR